MRKRPITTVLKIFIIAAVSFTTLSVVYYAPRIPPVLKPLMPAKFRWTTEELVDQIKKKEVDPDFLTFFNRDPERRVPDEKKIVVAPADGTIKVIKNVDNRQRIVIYMSLWDVHIQRVPMSGHIIEVRDSAHVDNDDFKCTNCPQKVTELETEVGRVTVKQVTSGLARRINVIVKTGDEVHIGDRLGSILLGSHTIIELPPHAKLNVKKGDKVYGAETIIARY